MKFNAHRFHTTRERLLMIQRSEKRIRNRFLLDSTLSTEENEPPARPQKSFHARDILGHRIRSDLLLGLHNTDDPRARLRKRINFNKFFNNTVALIGWKDTLSL